MANKNFIVKNGLEVGGQEVVSSSGVVTSAALGGQTLSTTDSPTFADLTLTGNLNLTGDINSYNVTDLDVTDQTITLGAGQLEALSGGSGIVVDGSGASILWDETNDEWDFNKAVNVTGSITSSGDITGTLATAAQPNITSVGTLTGLTTSGDINLGDNDKAIFGAGSDLEIYHDGSNSYIKDTGTGRLTLQSATDFLIANTANTQNYIYAQESGYVRLYYAGATKLATTSSGIDVTGTAVTDGLTVAGNVSVDGGTIKLDGYYPTGTGNVALGNTALDSITSGSSYNVAVGGESLTDLTTGSFNTAVGDGAAANTQTASNNSAFGSGSLLTNATGANNTGIGKDALRANTTASNNTAVGYEAGYYNSTGTGITAVGYRAYSRGSSTSNSTGSDNSAFGQFSLYSNRTGAYNVAVGASALQENTTGAYNVAVGTLCMDAVTTASQNVAMGWGALGTFNNTGTTNTLNTAIGHGALNACTTGVSNTYIGANAGDNGVLTGLQNVSIGTYSSRNGTSANYNTAVGYGAFEANTTGDNNVAIGHSALAANLSGGTNVAIGNIALDACTTGGDNTIIGYAAGSAITTGEENTAVGAYALGTNNSGVGGNTAVGRAAGYQVSSGIRNIMIGEDAGRSNSPFTVTSQSDRIVMGSSSITNAYINVAWTVTSDQRDKTEIQDIPVGLDLVNNLRPVSYKFRENRDSDTAVGKTKYGFLAQEVITAEGDNLVIADNEEADKLKITTDNLVAVLTKAIQEQQTIIENLQSRLDEAGL